ncbi:MAG: TraB/GumN family protein, partial [Geminicoccaceae bacterium]
GQALMRGAAFVAVGALHLPGEQGILNLLARKGYTVTRVY